MAEVGVTEAVDKRVMGSKGECLGKVFDMEAGEVYVPHKKLHRYLCSAALAHAALSSANPAVRASISQDFIMRLTGSLAWVAETTAGGSLHLNSMYSAAAPGVGIARYREAILRDLAWWLSQAEEGRLRTRLQLAGGEVHCVTLDASDVAVAAVTPEKASWRPLTERERGMSSTRRELRAMIVAAELIGEQHPGSTLMLCSDSLPAVLSLNKGRARHKAVKDLRALHAVLERHACHAVALWLPREFNRVADAASKCTTQAEFDAWQASRRTE
jgi:hypothetical protein